MNRRVDPRLLSRLGLVVVLVATALLYWPGTRGGFLLDDYPNIVDNPAMQSVSLSAADMWRVVESTQSGPTGRPIAMMSFALNAHFSGLSPQAMKVTNLVIHLVNGLLVFLFLRLLLGEYARLRAGRREEESRASSLPQESGAESAGGSELARDNGGGTSRTHAKSNAWLEWVALAVTAAWLLAPINLTAVLYIVQRMTSLSATFTLAALILFLCGRRWLHAHRRRTGAVVLLLAAALLCTPLAVLTKESGVLTLAYALVIEWVFFRFRNQGESRASSLPPADSAPMSRGSELARDKWLAAHREPARSRSPQPKGPIAWVSVAYFAIFLLVPLILGLLWLLPGVLSPADWTARGFTIGERLLTEGRVIWHYFYWTLVPDIGSMTLYHDAFPVSRGLFSPWTSLLAWAGIAALLAAGIFLGRRRPLVAFGLLWFLVGQTLTASFIPLELVFEHRQYLPSLGLLLVLFSLLLLSGVRLNLRRLLAGAAAALILLYAGSLALRSFQWSNPIRQAVAAARTHPQSPRATYELARMLLILSRHDPQLVQPTRRALNHARQVPGQGIIATAGLVLLANAEHQPLRAEWFAAMTAKLHARPPTPQDVGALDSLVQCAMRQRNPCRLPAGGMKNLFRAALAHKQPDGYVMAIHGNYLLNVLHRPRAAARIFSALVRRAPGNARYHFSLGVCLAFAGDADGARTELATLRRLNRNGAFDHGVRQLEGLIKRLYAEPKSS